MKNTFMFTNKLDEINEFEKIRNNLMDSKSPLMESVKHGHRRHVQCLSW